MSKTYMIDVGIHDTDYDFSVNKIGLDEVESRLADMRWDSRDIFAYAEELGFHSPSSGGGFGFRDAQFETKDKKLADHYVAWVEHKIVLSGDEESYVGVGVERRGWFWDGVLKPIWKFTSWLNNRDWKIGNYRAIPGTSDPVLHKPGWRSKPFEKLYEWQHR
jgi:hypothetical protein